VPVRHTPCRCAFDAIQVLLPRLSSLLVDEVLEQESVLVVRAPR
jgi:hypothetical protein